MKQLKNILFGIVLGIANIIPGISAGTMAVVLGIYDETVYSIAHFTRQKRKSFFFLLPLVIGIGAGIVLFAKLMEYLLASYPAPTNLFFIGIILGSIPMIYKRATVERFKISHLIPFLVALAMMVAMFLFSPEETTAVSYQLTTFGYFLMFLSGVLAAAAMVIPGISGSFLMLMLGQYNTIISAVSDFYWPILLIFGLGAIVGIIGVSKVITILLSKFPQAMYFGILGFVVGSIPQLIPPIGLNLQTLIGAATLIAGTLIAYFSSTGKNNPKKGAIADGNPAAAQQEPLKP